MSDAYATIKMAAKHNKLILVKNQQLAAGNSNSVFMEFQLRTDDWMTCNKIRAVFNDYYTRKLDDNLKCDIPAEVLATPGTFDVGLYGTNGSARLVTNKISFIVEEGACGCFLPDDTEEDDGKTYVYVPTISDDKILTLTLQEEPGVESVSCDLNPFDEWSEIDGAESSSDYIWEQL